MWEPLHVVFESCPDVVHECAIQKGLSNEKGWEAIRDCVPPTVPDDEVDVPDDEVDAASTTVADIDDETKLINGASIKSDDLVFEPMDDTTAAAEATAAFRRFK